MRTALYFIAWIITMSVVVVQITQGEYDAALFFLAVAAYLDYQHEAFKGGRT